MLKKIFNLRKNKNAYATGLVKPKTTALFFDKIWIPHELIGTEYGELHNINDVPKDVMITTEIPDFRLHEKTQNNILPPDFREEAQYNIAPPNFNI